MSDLEPNKHGSALAAAMVSVIGLIFDMDVALDEGCADIVPEEIVRKLEESAAPLMSEVTRVGLRDALQLRIEDYDLIRRLAPGLLDVESYLDNSRRLFFDDAVYVMDEEGWERSHPEFYTLFHSILEAIRPLEERFMIPW